MFFRQVGESDLRVSAVGLGTWPMGGDFWGPVEDAEAVRTIQSALDAGINLIDTAPAYGAGRAEEIIGKAIKGRRDKVVVATKVGVIRGGTEPEIDLSPRTITRELEGSLKRLKVDVIDLYQIHWPDPRTPLRESVEELARLREQGKFRYLGVSNFDTALLDQVRSLTQVVSLQSHYSLLNREIERRIVPYCLDNKLGLITYGTLAAAILTGKYRQIPRLPPSDHRSQFYDYFHEPLWGAAQRLVDGMRPIAEEHGRPVSQVAINWIAWQPGVTSALVGARTPEQARSNAEAGDWELSNDELDDIDDLCCATVEAVQST